MICLFTEINCYKSIFLKPHILQIIPLIPITNETALDNHIRKIFFYYRDVVYLSF